MNVRKRLEANLVSESEAYGYTLTIWGSGAMLIHSFEVPGTERAMAYVAGALVGFGALAVAAFRGLTTEAAVEESPSSLVASSVHIVATGGALGVVHLFLLLTSGGPPFVVFFSVGALATIAYNLLLLVEQLVVQWVV